MFGKVWFTLVHLLSTSKSRLKRYAKAFREWCESTTGHGIPNIVRTKNRFIRYMWIIFFLTSFTYCTYTIVNTFVMYWQYDTNININVLYESPTEFPAITICNLDPFSYYTQENRDILKSILNENNMSSEVEWSSINSSKPNDVTERYLTKLKRIIANKFMNNSALRKSLGFNLGSQMLFSCYYNKISCDESNFDYFWNNEYGNCYTFNSGKDQLDDDAAIFSTSRAGQSFGLEMELLVGNPNYTSQYTKTLGLFLIVHNSKKAAQFLTEGVNIPTGLETYVSVTKTLYNKLSSPYSNCIKKIENYKNLNSYSKTLFEHMRNLNLANYDQDLCYKLCFQDTLIKECNCGDIDVPLLYNKSYCQTDVELDCLDRINQRFASSDIDELCNNACPSECQNMKYDLVPHTATYPTLYYITQLINTAFAYFDPSYGYNTRPPNAYSIISQIYEYWSINKTSDDIDYDTILSNLKPFIVKLNINYKDLTYTVVQESAAMNFETLLGVLGGQLGLFIGMSFLSLVELIELTIQFVTIYRSNLKKELADAYNMSHQETAATPSPPPISIVYKSNTANTKF